MKATNFLILISFLAFAGRSHSALLVSYFLNKINGDDSEYLSGSDGDVVVSSQEDHDDYYYDYDDVHPEYTIGENAIRFVKDIYNYWNYNKEAEEDPKSKYVPKAGRSGDEYTMILEADEEIPNIDVIDLDEEPVLIAKTVKDQSDTEEIPTADLLSTKKVIIPEENVHIYDAPAIDKPDILSNELKEKDHKMIHNDIHQKELNRLIEKAKILPKNLKSVPKSTTSIIHEQIVNMLKESYMGDFDFMSLHDESNTTKRFTNKTRNFSHKLFNDFQGELWMNMNWKDLADNEFDNMLKVRLFDAAPNTITALPSLALKTTYERDVLENWLISGLLAAYPTLTDGVKKDDAIALILLAILSKSFINSENDQTVIELFKELHKYNGDLPNQFPLDQFTFDHDESKEESQAKLMRTLLRIVQERNLPFTRKVMDEIQI